MPSRRTRQRRRRRAREPKRRAALERPERYLVIDLEATCSEPTDPFEVPRHEMETIEIGAVLVDAATLLPIDELVTFVRPVRHPTLTPFCTQLTGIRQQDVNSAPGFAEALARLVRFMEGAESLFMSWGAYDRHQLFRDCVYHGLVYPFGEAHLDLKSTYKRRLGTRELRGLRLELEQVGLDWKGRTHRGIDDARNLARLLPWALPKAWVPEPLLPG